MGVIKIQQWLQKNNVNINKNIKVLCLDNGYNPHFEEGEIYSICIPKKGDNIKILAKRPNKLSIVRLDEDVLNKLFKPIGVSKRDRFLAKLKKCY